MPNEALAAAASKGPANDHEGSGQGGGEGGEEGGCGVGGRRDGQDNNGCLCVRAWACGRAAAILQNRKLQNCKTAILQYFPSWYGTV